LTLIAYSLLSLAVLPFVYYLLAIYSALSFFGESRRSTETEESFAPPASILKPVRGLDPEAFENFASFCAQDYPEYEVIFCATDETDPSVPMIQKLIREFPEKNIRLVFSVGHRATNDKVAKLSVMTDAARYEYLVISDSDVRVKPDYLRSVVGPFRDSNVGGATCFYVSIQDKTIAERFQTIGMVSDFYASIIVAWKLDGVHFALGPTMVTTKHRVQNFGGFRVLENRPADDLLLGRLIAKQGVEMKLLPYAVQTVPDYDGMQGLLAKRTRWMTVMRQMRPWGHFGLLFTWGLPWSLLAVAIRPTAQVAAAFFGSYLVCRVLIAWVIGTHGLKQRRLWKKFLLIPVWDAIAFWIWMVSFMRKSIQWRKVQHSVDGGQLIRQQQVVVNRAATKADP
jgi:ceramide glucosyltransferase